MVNRATELTQARVMAAKTCLDVAHEKMRRPDTDRTLFQIDVWEDLFIGAI